VAIVVVTDSDLGDGSIERQVLRDHDLRFATSADAEGIIRVAGDADGLLVQWARIDDSLLAQLPKLSSLVRYGIGLDNIDLDAAAARNITVANVPDYCIDEVAAHAVAFVLARARRLVAYAGNAVAGHWSLDGVDLPKAPSDDPVGVAGVGRIGRVVATQFAALGHPVFGWDPYAPSWPDGIERVETLVDLAAAVNHLSLHVPMLPATKGIADAQVFAALGRGGHLVNTSRGGLVNEQDLLAALNAGTLGFASLDVLSSEPPSGDAALLVEHPSTMVTPHAAYVSDTAKIRLQQRAAEIMESLLTSDR
jgi:D-3-phosphoglycerate dehydrogenase